MATADRLEGASPGLARPGGKDVSTAVLRWTGIVLVATVWASAGRVSASPALRLAGASGFLLLGTYDFTKIYWGPAILDRLPGL